MVGTANPVDTDDPVMVMLRPPQNEPNPTADWVVGFVDREKYKGPADEISPEAFWSIWAQILNHLQPLPLDLYKAGPVVWEHLQLPHSAEWLSEVLGLNRIDKATARAYQAAMMAAFMTTPGPVDVNTIHFALATFIRASARYASIIQNVKWHLPYGDKTALRLMRAKD